MQLYADLAARFTGNNCFRWAGNLIIAIYVHLYRNNYEQGYIDVEASHCVGVACFFCNFF